ncbi:unnamed protein product [Rangifer tarandus platyrhynchus]|uniref:Uncharacterized protein n=2 Tax=Rangifer tarandus platyrhynchus TaxID=3082113 RepID=A0ACB0ER86_RANTA|nr:unnamed protein product [Rangifer tarandus platyrhynchus]CAI9702783.1 unnamed protein product [Rangifer tarandus platyrhynchus]
MSVPKRRRRERGPWMGTPGTAHEWPYQSWPCTKRVPPPGRRHESPPPSLAASARPLRPVPRPAPFSARG